MPAKPPKKLNTKHQQIMMAMLLYPEKKQKEIAAMLGMTQAWVSTVVNSDLFQEQYSRLQKEVVGAAMVDAKTKAKVIQDMGMDSMIEKLSGPNDASIADLSKVVTAMDTIAHPERAQGNGGPVMGPQVAISITATDLSEARQLMRQNSLPALPHEPQGS